MSELDDLEEITEQNKVRVGRIRNSGRKNGRFFSHGMKWVNETKHARLRKQGSRRSKKPVTLPKII